MDKMEQVKKNQVGDRVKSKFAASLLLVIIAGATGIISTLLWSTDAFAAATESSTLDPEAMKWAFLAAALATGLSSLAAGYAVAMVASAAVGALVEKPELMGRVLILVGLAEGIAIYGLIISILILNRI